MPIRLDGKWKIKQRDSPVDFCEDLEEPERWPTPPPVLVLSVPPIEYQVSGTVGADGPDQSARLEGATGRVSKMEVLDSNNKRHAAEDKDAKYRADAEVSNSHQRRKGPDAGMAGVRTRL